MNGFKRTIATFIFTGAAIGWSKGNLQIENKAFIEKEVVAKDGTKSTKLVPASKVVPGEEVIFVITYRNMGKEPATDVVITNPIPKNMAYRSDVVEGKEVTTTMSIDGKKYGKLADLKVKDKLRKTRPALPDDVSHVQWKVASNLMPNEEGKVQLRAVLK